MTTCLIGLSFLRYVKISAFIVYMTNFTKNIKEGIEGHPAKWYSEVFDLVFPGISAEEGNNVWKAQLAKKESNDKASEEDD
jgi:hypothetical protein